MSKIKLFGIEHILYLVISFSITAALIILFKLFVKKEKMQNIIIKIGALIQLCLVILSRYTVIKYMDPGQHYLPYSFCTVVATIFSLVILLTKRDSFLVNGTAFLSIFCGLLPTIVATYINQGYPYGMDSLFFPCTIVSLLDHSFLLLLALSSIIIGYVKIDINKWGSFIVCYGLIALYSIFYYSQTNSFGVCNILSPALTIGSIELYFINIFLLTLLGYTIFIVIYDLIKNKNESLFPKLITKLRKKS